VCLATWSTDGVVAHNVSFCPAGYRFQVSQPELISEDMYSSGVKKLQKEILSGSGPTRTNDPVNALQSTLFSDMFVRDEHG
jgi:hypothetical protein